MPTEETKVNRTTITLYNAVFQLLEVHPFDEITVNDICQKALVSRSTFYSYFADKYLLIVFCLKQERSSLSIVKGENVKKNIENLLCRFQEKENIYRNMLIAQSNQELNRMIVDHVSGNIKFNLSRSISSPEKLEVLTILYSEGIAGTVIWWIENRFPIQSDKVAEYIHHTISSEFSSKG